MFRRKNKKNRAVFIIATLSIILGLAGLLYSNFRQNIMFFYAPSELSQLSINKKIRIGGMVKKGSIIYHDGNKVEFIITDFKQEIKTLYQGILPDLFREGQGVVANGRIKDNVFVADEILAKHDENYMPPVELGNKITPSPL